MWEEKRTPEGRPYYVDHVTQRTQWEWPGPGTIIVGQGEVVSAEAVPAEAVPTARPNVAQAEPVLVQSNPVVGVAPARPVVVLTQHPVVPAPQHHIVAQPPQPPPRRPRPAATAYVAPAVTAVPSSSAAAPAAKRSTLSAAWSRTKTLAKSTIVGKLAPSSMYKRGNLDLDGRTVDVELSKAEILIREPGTKETMEAPKGKEGENLLFRAPILYIRIVGDNTTARTVRNKARYVAPNEIRLEVDPDLFNKEIDYQRGAGMGFWGWNYLRDGGHHVATIAHMGPVQRQNFSLFAADATEKQAWLVALSTVAESKRDWDYTKNEASFVGSEIKDSLLKLTGRRR